METSDGRLIEKKVSSEFSRSFVSRSQCLHVTDRLRLNGNSYGAKSRDLTGTAFVCLFAFTALFVYVSLLFAFVPGAYVSTHRVFPTPNSLTFVLETIVSFLIGIRRFDKYLIWEEFLDNWFERIIISSTTEMTKFSIHRKIGESNICFISKNATTNYFV